MLYLIVGIVLGAAFHEFWSNLYHGVKNKIQRWTEDSERAPSARSDAEKVYDGEVVDSPTDEPSSRSA
ncbi:MAG: hypothetical protein HWE13_00705 [Gammaproteobacteria bacterium]|nr:hypothetical protein [Gammaproteobacteria bacterium]NVK86608.1 hypothetical protein [Gammaproteobacteria bacterium]